MYRCDNGEISRSLCMLLAIYVAVVAFRIADLTGVERPLTVAVGAGGIAWFVSSFTAARLFPL